ncbi:hypothetical protein T190820D02B_11199 [Tenacibaculum sp. 190524A05c]
MSSKSIEKKSKSSSSSEEELLLVDEFPELLEVLLKLSLAFPSLLCENKMHGTNSSNSSFDFIVNLFFKILSIFVPLTFIQKLKIVKK